MPRVVDGVSTILQGARLICRMVGRFGVAGLVTRTTPEFAAAVEVFVAACIAFEALDDYPLEVDASAPFGPEDTGG
jgi:hypothetical protein